MMPVQALGELHERRARVIPACISTLHDLVLREARGSTVVDMGNREYLDLTSGLGVMMLGYGHPDVTAAVETQLGRFVHASFPTFPHEPYVACAERLAHIAGHGRAQYKTCFFNSGAEAIDNAAKVARWATGRREFIAIEGSFHGRSWAALSLTAKSRPYKEGLGDLGVTVHRIPLSIAASVPRRARANRVEEEEIVECETALAELARGFDPAKVAGFFVETVLGEGGVVALSPAFLLAARRFCRRQGILLVADEIQCGLGRTGRWVSAADAEPDLILLGKAIGGGLPLSALVGRAEILDALHRGALGGTMGGNPVACAAGCAVVDVLERDQLLERAVTIGLRAREAFADLDGRCARGVRLEVRTEGAMIGIAILPESGVDAATHVMEILKQARVRGVLALRGGGAGEVVRLLPALNIDERALDAGFAILAETIAENIGLAD